MMIVGGIKQIRKIANSLLEKFDRLGKEVAFLLSAYDFTALGTAVDLVGIQIRFGCRGCRG
jgi:hypothetical protein